MSNEWWSEALLQVRRRYRASEIATRCCCARVREGVCLGANGAFVHNMEREFFNQPAARTRPCEGASCSIASNVCRLCVLVRGAPGLDSESAAYFRFTTGALEGRIMWHLCMLRQYYH